MLLTVMVQLLSTDNGNFIIDVDFGIIDNPSELNQKMLLIFGVLEYWIFIRMPSKEYWSKRREYFNSSKINPTFLIGKKENFFRNL